MTKYELTNKQKINLRKYLELISSQDKESIKLGIALFYNEFCEFKCPYRSNSTFRTSDKDFEYAYLNYRYSDIDCWFARANLLYWKNRINYLLFIGYYIDEHELSKTYIN